MKLYEISGDFRSLFDSLEGMEDAATTPEELESSRQAWFDTLEGLEYEYEQKAESVAVAIKEMFVEINALEAEEYRLSKRRERVEKRAEWLQSYLLHSMQEVKREKVETPKVSIKVQRHGYSVAVNDRGQFMAWAEKAHPEFIRVPEVKPPQPTVDKKVLKDWLKNEGNTAPGVELVPSVSVKVG